MPSTPPPIVVKFHGQGVAERKADLAVVVITVTVRDMTKSIAANAVLDAVTALKVIIRDFGEPAAVEALIAEALAAEAKAREAAEATIAAKEEAHETADKAYEVAAAARKAAREAVREEKERAEAEEREADKAEEEEAEAAKEKAETVAKAAGEAAKVTAYAAERAAREASRRSPSLAKARIEAVAKEAAVEEANKAANEAVNEAANAALKKATEAVNALYLHPSSPVITKWHTSPLSTSSVSVRRDGFPSYGDNQITHLFNRTVRMPDDDVTWVDLESLHRFRYKALAYVSVTFRDLERMGSFLNAVVTRYRHRPRDGLSREIKYFISDQRQPEARMGKTRHLLCHTDEVKYIVSGKENDALNAEAMKLAYEDAHRQAVAFANVVGKSSVVPVLLEQDGAVVHTEKEGGGKAEKAAFEPTTRTASVACWAGFQIE